MDDLLAFMAQNDQLQLEVVGELSTKDLAKSHPEGGAPVARPLDIVKRIHHLQAQRAAGGWTPVQISAELGVSVQGVRLLLQDPAFQELVSYYASQREVVWLATQEKAALVARLGLDMIQEKLEHDIPLPKGVSFSQLRQVTIDLLDRTDCPVKTPTQGPQGATSITLNFGTPITKPQGLTIDGITED